MKKKQFDFRPTLIGPTTIVRPVRARDWPGMCTAASDPEIWSLHPARDRYKKYVFRGFFDTALACGSAFTIEDLSSGNIIGSSRYHGLDIDKSEIEIGWTFLTRSYWGGSTNREIKGLMLKHAFRYVDTVIFWVGESNLRSRRAMEKIGGIQRPEVQSRTLGTIVYPHVVYEISKHNYR